MGGNRINILIASVVMLALAIWAVSFILTLQDVRHQLAIMGVIAVVFVLLTIKQEIPIDGKLLLFVMTGYFIAGKGFAYLSPYPPVYIGEIFFAFCVLGFLWRSGLNIVSVCRDNVLNTLILVACGYALCRLIFVDLKLFKVMALRDSAMVYYSFIAVACSSLFKNKKFSHLFNKALPWMVFIGFISHSAVKFVLIGTGLYFIPALRSVYTPHPDVLVALTSAVAMMGFYYVSKKEYKGLIFLLAVLAVLATGKTALAFAFVLVAAVFLLWGKMKSIFGLGAVMVVVSVLVGGVLLSVNSDSMEIVEQTDVAGTIDVLGEGGTKGTTGWRLTWWRIVIRDTYHEAPLLGLGLGSDITTNFLQEGMKIDVANTHHQMLLTRYPHCILLTVFGRLGFVGLVFFLIYCVFFMRFCLRYCKYFIARTDRELIDVLLLAFVLAGFFNAFVQSTYENPYAGIPHWICLGAMMARYSTRKNKLNTDNQSTKPQLT